MTSMVQVTGNGSSGQAGASNSGGKRLGILKKEAAEFGSGLVVACKRNRVVIGDFKFRKDVHNHYL